MPAFAQEEIPQQADGANASGNTGSSTQQMPDIPMIPERSQDEEDGQGSAQWESVYKVLLRG